MNNKAILVDIFFPLTNEKMDRIIKLSQQYKKLTILSYDEDLNEKSLNTLFKALKGSLEVVIFFNDENIKIDAISDVSEIEKFKEIGDDLYINKEIAVLSKGTSFQNEKFTKFSQLSKFEKRNFVKTFCIVGAESTGKSNYIKNLSLSLDLDFSTEWGRTFVLMHANKYFTETKKYILDERDYEYILFKQQINNRDIINKSKSPVVLIDTDSVFTQYLFNRHFGHKSKIVDAVIENENHDFYLFIKSNTEHNQDGVRLTENEDDMLSMENELIDFYKSYNKNLIFIDEDNYYDNFNKMRDFIKEEVKNV